MDIEFVRNWNPPPRREHYDAQRTMLYALGAGAGYAPEDLSYVYEKQLKALPTMAVVLASEGFWFDDPRAGIDWKNALHGEQSLELHRPLPPVGEVIGRTRVDAIYDKGPNKGAQLIQLQTLHDAQSDALLATIRATVLLRGDGGFGGSSAGLPKPHPLPERPCDTSIALATRPEQAAIYRLSGDRNPLHIDPAVAQQAGFERPILHGLCSYAFAGRAVIKALCNGDPERLQRLDVRFSNPVFPGDTLVTEIWHEAEGVAAFRVRVLERGIVAIDNGLVKYRRPTR
jgi:acyl dehydratase